MPKSEKSSNLIRFGVSLSTDLLNNFDLYIQKQNYTNRSEAIRDLIRTELIKEEWTQKQEIAGAIIFIYDHHVKKLLEKTTEIQHEYEDLIISTQHIHLDHRNCLEIIAVKGQPNDAKNLCAKLKALKGIKHAALSMSSTGKEIN